MTIATKTVKFDAAHVLTNHQGACRNLHGHTYRVDISLAGDEQSDMVIDFKDLKRMAAESICDRFDHSFIYNTGSPAEVEIAAVLEKHGMKTVAIPFRSTAENLAKYFHDCLSGMVPAHARLVSVKVWETAENCAEYRAV